MKHNVLETLNRPNMENKFDGQIAGLFLKQEWECLPQDPFKSFIKSQNRI